MEHLHPLTKLSMLICINLLVFTAADLVVSIIFVLLGMIAFSQRKRLLSKFLGISILNKRLLFILPFFIP